MKRGLLITYMVVCIALIGAILVSGLDGDEAEGQPGFYRATAESVEGIYQAQTEAAATAQPASAGGQATPTEDLELRQTLDAIPTIQD
jgi:hypothetical protein